MAVDNNDIHFDEDLTKIYLLVVFETIDSIYGSFEAKVKLFDMNQKAGIKAPTKDDAKICLGALISCSILVGHTTELLLKLKLQLEGKEIPKTHNLSTLFRGLSENLRTDIEDKYKDLKDENQPWGIEGATVDSLFESDPEPHFDWRYLTEDRIDRSSPDEDRIGWIHWSSLDGNILEKGVSVPFLLLAAKSIYQTL